MAQISLSPVFVRAYEKLIRLKAQQGISRLRPYVAERHEPGQYKLWDRLSAGSFQQKTTQSQATPGNNSGTLTRRRSTVATYDAGDVLENEDIVQVISNVESSMVESMGKAMKRAVDDLIIASATAAAADESGSTTSFPAGQTIGTGAEVMSFDIVTNATEIFLGNDIDPDTPKTMFVGQKQMRKLLQLTEATSDDYANVKALAGNGYIESWMGYRWVVSTRLTKPTPGTDIRCFACTDRALGLHVAKDIWSEIARDPSISFAWRIYNALTMGCVRVEDEHIVQLYLADSL